LIKERIASRGEVIMNSPSLMCSLTKLVDIFNIVVVDVVGIDAGAALHVLNAP
jgi:hypothetical protein